MSVRQLWERWIGSSIRAKLMLATVFSSIVAVSLVITGVMTFDSRRAQDELENKLRSLTSYTVYHVTVPFDFGSQFRDDAMSTLAELDAFPDIERAWVVEEDGDIFVLWEKSPREGAELPSVEEDGLHRVGDGILSRATFVAPNSHRNGVLYIESNLGSLARLRGVYGRLAILALITGAVSAALALLPLRRWVAGPIGELASAARRVSSSRDYDVALPRASNDEVGVLVVAFEDMLREIRRREAELRKATELAERAASEASRQANETELANIQLRSEMSERRRLEEQLLQSQKMESIGQLAGGIAHDFNNLLTVMLGWTEYAGSDPVDVERMKEGLDQIRQSADRAAGLTRQLLAFARRQVVRPRVTDLNSLIDDLARMLRRVIGEHVELRLDLAPELEQIYVDPGQFEQVLLNMALNAKDAMPQGGQLAIRTRQIVADEESRLAWNIESECISLEVIDTGTGIPESIRGKIFEPFFTTKPQGQGTGLGLSMCYGIVQQAGGSILVESTPNGGTIFRILIPIAAEGIARDESEKLARSGGGGNELVLIAEDERAVRQLLESTLRSNGYRVLSAVDGLSALRLAAEHDYEIDILVSDIVMPNLGGRELVDKLRAERPDLPAVFVSGYDPRLFDSRDHAELPSGVELIEKPFAPSELMRAIRAALSKSAPS